MELRAFGGQEAETGGQEVEINREEGTRARHAPLENYFL
jgi:hypothetical protein